MFAHWTFARRIAVGFALVVMLTVVVGVIATLTLQNVIARKDQVITVDAPLMVQATQMQTLRQTLTSGFRNFMLSSDPDDLETLRDTRASFEATIATLRADAVAAEGVALVEDIQTKFNAYNQGIDAIARLRQSGTSLPDTLAAYTSQITPLAQNLSAAINAYLTFRQASLDASRQASSDAAAFAEWLIIGVVVVAIIAATLIAFYLGRSLNALVGNAVSQVQSSSAELHAAANQQATGVKEQVTSMSEISTTINELLVTSRQIADSAQRVTLMAEQTANATTSGRATVDRATQSIAEIARQMETVVGHMLELGKKSQKIGSVLDIVTELAEQTNILSINATIEAAGAGEGGKRFSVVADEIRKLADRVGDSAKEIRGMIDDVRSSVNATVMVTETGSKAVELGSREFGVVSAAFSEIAGLVGNTSEAAREIELSTKQQSTAVEQVNVAIANVAQATRETEASAGQTTQTAAELAATSRGLLRLVQADAAT
jgi:methyl-accepting chemotaxis protein